MTMDRQIQLCIEAKAFIEHEILPFMQSQSDGPEWWVDQAEGFVESEVLDCVRDALQECVWTDNGKIAGITTAKQAVSMLAWTIEEESNVPSVNG